MTGGVDEFGLIAEFFAPLSASCPGALGLTDDAAFLSVPTGQQLVLTMDAMVAGIHFFPDDPPDLIARKLVRVNLSDLAAKGAKPLAIMLAAAFPHATNRQWVQGFAAGLAEDCHRYELALIGGDTVSTPGPLTLTITAYGLVPDGQGVLRQRAKVGDVIWVSGTIGDAALGLRVCLGQVPQDPDGFLRQRYLLPQPRVDLGQALRNLAHAGMDISDGLVQDLGHLCRQSGVGALVRAADVPLSEAAAKWLSVASDDLSTVLTGGDDYEILWTAPPHSSPAIRQLAESLSLPLTAIGEIRAGQGVQVVGPDGQDLPFSAGGWRHFRNQREESP